MYCMCLGSLSAQKADNVSTASHYMWDKAVLKDKQKKIKCLCRVKREVRVIPALFQVRNIVLLCDISTLTGQSLWARARSV